MGDHEEFWQIIEAGRHAGLRRPLLAKLLGRAEFDQERQLAAITAELDRLSPDQLVAFKVWLGDQMQRANRWDLWGAAYVMCGGCGDDSFEYFRAWLLGQGRQAFDRAIEDPETLADLSVRDPEFECEFESLIYVAADVYEQKTGSDLYGHLPEDATPRGPVGEPFDESTVFERYPHIAAKWGGASGR